MNGPPFSYYRILVWGLLFSLWARKVFAEHHMKRAPVHWVNKRDSSLPLQVVNYCQEDVYPGIQTQAGTGPQDSGFLLRPGDSHNQTVSADWQGRVWARTNCSFNAAGTAPANNAPGKACMTGDCGGTVACKGTVSKSFPIGLPLSFRPGRDSCFIGRVYLANAIWPNVL